MNEPTSFPLLLLVSWLWLLQGLILLPHIDAGANYYYGCMNVTVSSSDNDINKGSVRGATLEFDDDTVMICADYYESTWSYTSNMSRDESPYYYEYGFTIRDPRDYNDSYEELFWSEKEYSTYINSIDTFFDYGLYEILPQYVTVEIPYSRTGSCTIAMDGQKCEKCTICDTNVRGDMYMDASISVDCNNIIIGRAHPNSNGNDNESIIKVSESCTPLQPLYFPFVIDRSPL